MKKLLKDSKNNKILHYGASGSKDSVFTVFIIIFVALASFGLGRLSKIQESKPPIKITNPAASVYSNLENSGEASLPKPNSIGAGESTPPTAGNYVASRSGAKYHLPWCSGATRIKEENKIWFKTKADAEKAGYTPASNCKGI